MKFTKNIIILICFLLVGNLSAQIETQLYSFKHVYEWGVALGGTDNVDLRNYHGINLEHSATALETTAQKLKTVLEKNNVEVPIFDFIAYPLASYMDPQDGMDASISAFMQYVESSHDYYIVFISKHNKQRNFSELDVEFKIPESSLSSECQNNLNFLLSTAKKKLLEAFEASGRNSLFSNDAKHYALDHIESRLSTDCNVSGEEQVDYLVELEFDIISLNGMKVIYPNELETFGEIPNPDKKVDEKRDECTLVDYTNDNLRCETDAGDIVTVKSILNYINLPGIGTNRILLLDYVDTEGDLSLENIIQQETNTINCDRVTIIYFPGHFSDNKDSVAIKVINKWEVNDVGGENYTLTLEQFMEKYENDGYANDGLFKIKTRLKDYKYSILNYCNGPFSGSYTAYKNDKQGSVKLLISEHCEYQLGLAAGFGDGAIETIDFVSIALQYLGKKFYEIQQQNPASHIFWQEVIAISAEKRDIFAGVSHKFGDAWKYWKGTANSIYKFAVSDWEGPIVKVLKFFKKMFFEWFDNASFKNGNFEAGYAHGKVVFEVAIEIALAVFTGGTGNVAKGMIGVMKAGKELGKKLVHGGIKIIEDAKAAGKNFSSLAAKFLKDGTAVVTSRVIKLYNIIKNEIYHATVVTNYLLNGKTIGGPNNFSLAMVGAGVTPTSPGNLSDYQNSFKNWITKMKNGDPPNKGKNHEWSNPENSVIYNDPEVPGERGALAILEESADKSELIPKFLATLPAKCKEYLIKFSDGALKDLGTKGDEGVVLANRLENPVQVKAMQILDQAGFTYSRKSITTIKKLEKLLTNSNLSSSGLSDDIITQLLSDIKIYDDAVDIEKLLTGLDELVTNGNKKLATVSNKIDYLQKLGLLKHPSWIEVLNITSKVLAKKIHVLTVENLSSVSNYTPQGSNNSFLLEGFTGVHSEKALINYTNTNGGTYSIKNKSTPNAGGAYDGQPVINLAGKDYVKTNGMKVQYEPGKYGGTSSFFPDSWPIQKVLDEVGHAVKNNHGKIPGTNNTYRGYSSDGLVEIHFYYNLINGKILSYFPKI